MAPEDLTFISTLIKQRSGIVLTADKTYLIESRLAPLAQSHGMKGVDALVARLRDGAPEALLREVVDAMTTNETFFFRDGKPFDMFRDWAVPELLKRRKPGETIRIWCAAASTGQEPYTLALILKEMEAKLGGRKVEIVATDISADSIARAREGTFSQFEVQRGLPIQLLVKYFAKKHAFWQVSPEIKAMVNFRELNLLDDFRHLGRFDIVFCRNVLIYFDAETKADILGRIRARMPDDGYLYLGGAETVLGITPHFSLITGQRGIYSVATDGKGGLL